VFGVIEGVDVVYEAGGYGFRRCVRCVEGGVLGLRVNVVELHDGWILERLFLPVKMVEVRWESCKSKTLS
jgi:hypothetical protein